MPTYDYLCENGHRFEYDQPNSMWQMDGFD